MPRQARLDSPGTLHHGMIRARVGGSLHLMFATFFYIGQSRVGYSSSSGLSRLTYSEPLVVIATKGLVIASAQV
jgi:hypothetical protein